jgi:CheY-like chemotaxis protein
MPITLASSRPSTMTEPSQDKQTLAPDEGHWREIIGQIGTEVGLPLSAALERVTVLATTGKIDRAGLRMLREEIERARRAGMIGQQLARFASGRIRQSPEQISVTQMLREVLLQRGREVAARQLDLSQVLKPAEVVADATLLYALLQAIVDWSLDLAQKSLEFKLDVKAWPPYARLTVQFEHASSDASDRLTPVGTPLPSLDSMAWRLVQQISWTLGLMLDRAVSEHATTLTIEFPRTVHDEIEGVSVVEMDQGFGVSDNSKPLAGSHVLVVASGREVRSLVKESIRHMGLLVDFVNSVEEAEEFCRDALPHAIIYESVLSGDRFHRLRTGISSEMPSFVFIEISPEGSALQLSTHGNENGARIGREAVMQSLPSALIFELSRTL